MSHKHVYAIPAYGDSPYLESCIKSLKAQNVTSPYFHTKPVFGSYGRKI